MCKSESAVKVLIEVQVAIMSRPITSYFATNSEKSSLVVMEGPGS